MTTTFDILDPAIDRVGDAVRALTNIRWLMHAHNEHMTQESDNTSPCGLEYLLQEYDVVRTQTEAAILAYAEAVDPSGAELACVREALAEPVLVPWFPVRVGDHAVSTENPRCTTDSLWFPVRVGDHAAVGMYVVEA